MVKIQLMKLCPFRFWTFSGSALFWLLASYPVTAQIVPDTTLPNNSSVNTINNNIINITEGTRAGSNLFHSFKEFSIRTGESAQFNADNITNIISRVTGGSISNIDGLIRANGTANLFFINPSGIVFGPNASLQIGGSFVASTANSLRFADGTEFSATNPQAPPLLTVSVPLGLQFGSNPGEIVNRSTAGLQVLPGKTLALVGGNLALEGGNLTAVDGRIELGSVGTGSVNLTESPQGYALGYSGVQNFQDIKLSDGARVEATGESSGGIQVQGRNINLTSGAEIKSFNSGAGTGGTLTVNAADVNLSGDNTKLLTSTSGIGSAGKLTIETRKLTVDSGAYIQTATTGSGSAGDLLVRATDVELSGTTADGNDPSGLFGQVQENATGKGGNLTIETGQLRITDGAAVDASTFGAGQAGNVVVKATDGVELVGDAQNFPSGIFAQVGMEAIPDAGDAGTLTIETGRLTVKDGAQISTAARKRGNGGELSIKADSITLSGVSQFFAEVGDEVRDLYRSGIFVSAEKGASGNVGNLKITSGLVTVENGAKISAENTGSGQGGSLTLDVRQLTIQNGGLVRANSFAEGPGGILTVNAAESVNVIGAGPFDVSTLSAAAQSSGPAGNLNITTRSLKVQNEGQVSVSGTGSGPAGKLTITANDLRLNRGKITATTNAGVGANITLGNLNLLLMQNQSLISARAFNNANGGNINIDASNGSVVAVPGQDNNIIANAIEGRGGEINITTSGIFGIEEREQTSLTNDIDASSQFGLAGSVNINRPDVEPNLTLPELSTVLVDASALVDTSSCAAFANSEDSSFTITGRGGLPPNPYEPLSPDVVWSDTRIPKITTQRNQVTTPPPSDSHVGAIVPATGWVFNGKGQVTLISHASRTPGLGSTAAKCPKQ